MAFLSTTDPTPVRLEVGGRAYVIRRHYSFHPPELDSGPDGFLLRVLIPDLDPLTEEMPRSSTRRASVGK